MMEIVLLEIMLWNKRAGYLNVVNRNITLFITSHCIHFRLSLSLFLSLSLILRLNGWVKKDEKGRKKMEIGSKHHHYLNSFNIYWRDSSKRLDSFDCQTCKFYNPCLIQFIFVAPLYSLLTLSNFGSHEVRERESFIPRFSLCYQGKIFMNAM